MLERLRLRRIVWGWFCLLSASSVLIAAAGSGPDEKIEFTRLTASSGLSQDSVTCVAQDRRRMIWIGTADGLNCYTGCRFKIFKHHASDPASLSNNSIEALFVDSEGETWIGTRQGLDRFDPDTERFVHCLVSDGANRSPLGRVTAIAEDRANRLWISSLRGLYMFDGTRQRLTRHADEEGLRVIPSSRNMVSEFLWFSRGGKLFQRRGDRLDPVQLLEENGPLKANEGKFTDSINFIVHDRQGDEWLCTRNGLWQMHPAGHLSYRVRRWRNMPGDAASLVDDNVLSALQDDKGFYWFGTERGLSLLIGWREGRPVFRNYRHNPENPSTLGGDAVRHLYLDPNGILWVATYGGGLTKIVRKPRHFNSYRYDPDASAGLKETSVLSICEDSDGVLWLGGELGLSRFNRSSSQFDFFRMEHPEGRLRPSGPLRALHDSGDGSLWIGGSQGLSRFDKRGRAFQYYRHRWPEQWPEERHSVRTILPWRDGNLLLGTKCGLVLFQRSSETFTLFRGQWPHDALLNSYEIYSLRLDDAGTLWVGTLDHGLFGLSTTASGAETLRQFNTGTGDAAILRNNSILCIEPQTGGLLWLGTQEGLCRLDTKSGRCKTYTEAEGLANTMVYGVLTDSAGSIWLSTNNGIARLDPQKEIFKNYFIEDGLANNEFNGGAYHRCRDGMMAFGGITGFTSFFPREWMIYNAQPAIAFIDFQVLSSRANHGLNMLLARQAGPDPGIHLQHDENSFSIEFAALDYTDPRKNEYSYKMDGVDDRWIFAGNRYVTTYTKLKPGNYFFRIRAASAAGAWNEQGLSLPIRIEPPFWATGWFRMLAGVAGLLILFGMAKIRVHNLKQRLQKQRLEEEMKFKADLTAMIVHDLRTPLTCIRGYAELLEMRCEGERLRRETRIIRENADKMLHLINEMLDLSKFEAGRMVIQHVRIDLTQLAEDVIRLLQPLVEKKHLRFNLRGEEKALVLGDGDKIGQVIQNLLGNAIKFSPERASILVTIQQRPFGEKTFWEFSIADKGPGISQDHQQVLFNKYAQLQQPSQMRQGTGLGLAISKMIIEAHGGEIGCQTVLGQGSVFFFRLPAMS